MAGRRSEKNGRAARQNACPRGEASSSTTAASSPGAGVAVMSSEGWRVSASPRSALADARARARVCVCCAGRGVQLRWMGGCAGGSVGRWAGGGIDKRVEDTLDSALRPPPPHPVTVQDTGRQNTLILRFGRQAGDPATAAGRDASWALGASAPQHVPMRVLKVRPWRVLVDSSRSLAHFATPSFRTVAL